MKKVTMVITIEHEGKGINGNTTNDPKKIMRVFAHQIRLGRQWDGEHQVKFKSMEIGVIR